MDSYNFEFLPLEGKVDRQEGIIKDVSVITAGVEAKGHKLKTGEGLHTDMTTLQQMKDVGNEMIQVPVKWNHRTGADAVNGYLCNFSIRGQKLVADWVLLKSHERYDHALEIAEKMPKGVGLSASFRGKSEVKSGKAFARCEELPSVDLVATPAANPDGLFNVGPHVDQLVDTFDKDMSDNKTQPVDGETTVNLGDVLESIKQLGERLAPLEQFQSEVSEAIAEDDQEFAEGVAGEDQYFEEGSADVDPIAYFESRLSEIAEEAETQDYEEQFAQHEARVHDLCAVNAQLIAENDAMASVLREFSGQPVEFSAASEDGAVEVVTYSVASNGRELTQFQARCHELEAQGKDATEAITFAIEEDENRYSQHLVEIGGIL